MYPSPADPALLSHFHSVLTKLQPIVAKRPALTPEQTRYTTQSPASMQSSYATRAAATTYTSSTSTT